MTTTLLETPVVDSRKKEKITSDEFLRMSNEKPLELIDGQIVERFMGAEADFLGLILDALVLKHVQKHKLGLVFGAKTGYQIFPDTPDEVRFPDGSFIQSGRLANDKPPKGYVRIPPDLAIEVVSPHDEAEEVEAKRLRFLKAGTRLVWVVYPESRSIHVFRSNGTFSSVTHADVLCGEDVLPGFKCKVAELFEDTAS